MQRWGITEKKPSAGQYRLLPTTNLMEQYPGKSHRDRSILASRAYRFLPHERHRLKCRSAVAAAHGQSLSDVNRFSTVGELTASIATRSTNRLRLFVQRNTETVSKLSQTLISTEVDQRTREDYCKERPTAPASHSRIAQSVSEEWYPSNRESLDLNEVRTGNRRILFLR